MVEMKIRITERDEALFVKIIRIDDSGTKEIKYVDTGMEWGEPEFGDEDVRDAIAEAFPNDKEYRINLK